MQFNDEFYTKCNNQRLKYLEKHFGKSFFNRKSVLDLGGGVGRISGELSNWGAQCTVYEGRIENIKSGEKLFPNVKFMHVDLEKSIPIIGFDIVLNFGVFYHLINPERFFIETVKMAKVMMLIDGNVSTDIDQRIHIDDKSRFDQSLHGAVKLMTEESMVKIFAGYKVTNLNSEMDEIAKLTGSPYNYRLGGDFLKRHKMKRTMLLVEPVN